MNLPRLRIDASRATTGEAGLLAGLSLLAAVIVVGTDVGVLTPDTKPEIFLQPAQTASRFASSWLDTPNLGSANYNTGNAPVAALFALPDALGVPAWLTLRLWRLSLVLLAGAGARLVVRHLLDRRATAEAVTAAGVAGAVAYAANPYVIVGGGTTPTMLPYALLPWLVLCWLRGARAPSWRWAGAAALVLAAMSGINAGVVPLIQLVVVLPLLVHVVLVEGLRALSFFGLLLRTALLYVLLSAYWLVPALYALGVGASVAESTESTEAIHSVSSFSEVLRGLGMWTLYGADSSGPFDPGRLDYVTSPTVILLSFGWPVVAALGVRLSMDRARVFASTSVLIGALVMVGTFPGQESSPWARLVGWALDEVPGLIAFRTTNKAGAVLELGLAVLVGLAAAEVVPRLRDSATRWSAGLVAGAVLAGSIAPALQGNLFWVRMDVPEYWYEAAEAVNKGDDEGRVLMVPGTAVPEYSWGYHGPDELGPSMFTRPFAFRSAAVTGGEFAESLMAGVDRRLLEGTAPPGTVSALASYIGAGTVVARYDGATRQAVGSVTEAQLESDARLTDASRFGPPEVAQGAEAPVVVRSVDEDERAVPTHVRAGAGALLVDGAGSGLPDLQAAGLLDGRPGLLLAGTLTDEQLADALRDGARVVLTDSNTRRGWSASNPAQVGPALGPEEDPGSTSTILGAEDQTVSRIRGGVKISTRGEGLLFDEVAHGAVALAFDGDRTTAWRFGDFGSGVGNAVDLTPRRPTQLSSVTLTPMHTQDSRITEVTVTAVVDGRPVKNDVQVPEWRSLPATVALPTGPISTLSIEVTGVAGSGMAPVGFSEISIPELDPDRVLELPGRLKARLPGAASAAGVALSDVPVDVVLRRGAGDASNLLVEESTLERELTLPDEREFTVSGTVRLSAGASDEVIDAMAGRQGRVSADSSSRLFHRPAHRASMALDGSAGAPDLETAWVPHEPVTGEWIAVDFPERRLSSFTLTQGEGAYASRALVSLDDAEPFEVVLQPGKSTITLPRPTEASRVRVVLTERQGVGPVRVTDLGLPRVSWGDAATHGCTAVATLDGVDIQADLSGQVGELLAGRPVPFESCDQPAWLGHRTHRIAGVSPFSVDDLHLRSTGPSAAPATSVAPPAVAVTDTSGASVDLRFEADCVSCYVSSGQAFDQRWEAALDGTTLGAPIVLDGYAAGWRVDAEAGDVLRIRFGPSRAGSAAWWVSGATALVALGLCASPWWRRRGSR